MPVRQNQRFRRQKAAGGEGPAPPVLWGSRRLLPGLTQRSQTERGCHHLEDEGVVDAALEQLRSWSQGRQDDIVGCVHALALRKRQIALHARGLRRAIGFVGNRLVVFLLRRLERSAERGPARRTVVGKACE